MYDDYKDLVREALDLAEAYCGSGSETLSDLEARFDELLVSERRRGPRVTVELRDKLDDVKFKIRAALAAIGQLRADANREDFDKTDLSQRLDELEDALQ